MGKKIRLTLAEEEASCQGQIWAKMEEQETLYNRIRVLMAREKEERARGRDLSPEEGGELRRALADHEWNRKQLDILRANLRDIHGQLDAREENRRLHPTSNAITVIDPQGACIKATGGKISFRAFLEKQGTPRALEVAAMKLPHLDEVHGADYWAMICAAEDPKLLKGAHPALSDRSLPESE